MEQIRFHTSENIQKFELSGAVFSTPRRLRTFKPRFPLPKLTRINFFFSCGSETSTWILRRDHSVTKLQFIRRVKSPPTTESHHHAHVSLRQLSCFEETLEAVGRGLGPPLDECGRRELIEYAWTKALEMALPNLRGHKVLDLQFDVCVERKNVFEREVVECFREAGPDFGGRSVIGSDYCSICLEGFSGDGGGGGGGGGPLGMPCLHVFHGSCIGKWLRVTPFCPICRSRCP